MKNKDIDTITWKFSRIEPVELAGKLELDQEIEIKIKGGVIQEIVGTNNDGTVNVCYVVKPITIELNDNK